MKKKWKNLLGNVRKDAGAQKHPPMGGGPQPYSDTILDIYDRNSESVAGITNAIESSIASAAACVEQQQSQEGEI